MPNESSIFNTPEVPFVEGYRNFPGGVPPFDPQLPNLPDGSAPGLSGLLIVDTTALGTAAALADIAADETRDGAQRLENQTRLPGEALWGDDLALGKAFGEVFAEPRQTLLESVRQVPDLLDHIVRSLREAQGTFVDVEDDAVRLAKPNGQL